MLSSSVQQKCLSVIMDPLAQRFPCEGVAYDRDYIFQSGPTRKISNIWVI